MFTKTFSASCEHIKTVIPYSRSEFMVLDEATVRNLEIFYSASFQGRKGSLIDVVDHTRTAMGGRKLQQWLRYPLLDLGRDRAKGRMQSPNWWRKATSGRPCWIRWKA